ncbi:M56 family metallopeptidase [Bacteroidota bacterium]
MNLLSTYLSGPTSVALGWTIIHSLWQGLVIGLIAVLILKIQRQATAQFRYLVGVSSLAAILVSGIITFYFELQPEAVIASGQFPLQNEAYQSLEISSGEIMNPGSMDQIQQVLSSTFPWMTTIWLLGVLLLSFRLLGGFFHVNRIRNHNVSPLPEYWNDQFKMLVQKSGINRVIHFKLSGRITVPTVIGVIKPVILVPAGIISLMPVEQLESIIAHELAHIRRYDYLINIIQSLIEALFFYHPVVWLLSSSIRQEREKCCDDYAVRTCGKLSIYARALAGLGEYQAGAIMPAVALSGNKNRIIHRVERLINPKKMKNNASEKIVAGLIIIGSAIIMTLSTGASPTLKFNLKALEKTPEVIPVQTATVEEPVEPRPIQEIAEPAEPLEPSPIQEIAEPAEPVNPDPITEPAEPAEPAVHADHDTICEHNHLKMDIKDNVVTREFITKDGTEKSMRFVIRKGKVQELYVDGKKIPESEHSSYQKEIDKTLEDLVEMETDLREAREDIENIDWEEIQREVQEEMEHFSQHEMAEIQEQMKQLQQEEIDIQIDHKKMQEEIARAMEEMNIDKEEMRKQMEEARKQALQAMEDHKSGKYALSEDEFIEMEKAMKEAMEEMESFDHEEMMKRMEKEMLAIQEIDQEKIQREIHEAMKELEKIDFAEIELNMKESLKHMELEHIHVEKELKSLDELIEELEKLELKEE